jgi:Uma2 family endonuclease
MATVAQPRITAKEFLKMDLGEGRHELVRGAVVTMTPPEYWHGYICTNIAALLREFGRRTGHGHVASNDARVDVSDDTVRGADVAYYREDRWPRARVGKEPPPGAPDLAVEVISKNDRPGKVLEKVADYLAAGVPLVWVVHPRKRTISIYRRDDPEPDVLRADDAIENLPELPGFRCLVAELFD